MKNIEIKARSPGAERLRALLTPLGARPCGFLPQVDTYFRVPRGRLKLRVMPDRAELIHYQRADGTGPRESDYQIHPVGEPGSLRRLLASSLGIRSEVRKVRELWLLENVRIHLDEVEELGSFLELEAVLDGTTSEAVSRERVDLLLRSLGVREEDLISRSYVDLLELTRSTD